MSDPNTQSPTLDYIGSTDFNILKTKIHELKSILTALTAKSLSSRKLRYAEIDIEGERKAGRIAPDELYIPQHIIDTNIRREQSAYVQYITQSPRAVILRDKMDEGLDLSLLEEDLTDKLRFNGWQLGMYANIDGFQANGYGVMETTLDQVNSGELGREYIQYGDFAFISDTRNLQSVEMCARQYYITRTELLRFTDLANVDDRWDRQQVMKVIEGEPTNDPPIINYTSSTNKSLFKIQKIMMKKDGIVQVAWACDGTCDNWLRKPRPLYLGRRKLNQDAARSIPFVGKVPDLILKTLNKSIKDEHIAQIKKGLPPSDMVFEKDYPFFLYPYLISENDTIQNLKGRIFLDQDTQNAATSLLSSSVTKARRASGLYFTKDTSDPNDDFLMQKNVYFKTGALINGKIKELTIESPDPAIFSAINMIVSANQNETSQINFAANNRKDSRKTATEIQASTQQAAQLSTVQVTLFSTSLKEQYTYEVAIIQSRVQAGLIKVNPDVLPLYSRTFSIKPSGDTDVIEKQQLVASMQQAWPVIQNTPIAQVFFLDLIEKMFPDSAAKYANAYKQAMAQQQSQQAQQQQQMMGAVKQLAAGVSNLSKHPEMFSETGKIHALPIVQNAAEQIEQFEQSQKS